jgi:molybdenum cofactor biosynthesis enzyme
MVISDIHLVEKKGGKSGHYVRSKNPPRKDTE